MRYTTGLFGLLLVTIGAAAAYADKPLNAEIYGSWSLIHPAKNARKSDYAISQVVAADPKGTKVLLGVTVHFAGSPPQPVIDFRVGPSAVRKAGIGLKIDDRDELRLAFAHCDSKACVASSRLDAKVLEWLKAGKVAQFAYLVPEKQMTLPVSLAGFSEAFSALQKAVATSPEPPRSDDSSTSPQPKSDVDGT